MRAARTEPVAANSDREIDVVAKTLWGEARGEGEDGMRAVACVIGNRKALRWRGKTGFAAVCLDRFQFSCWNDNDPNRARLEAIDRTPDASFAQALVIAREVVSNQLGDFTFGATHYFASSLKSRPFWAQGKNTCFQLGKHLFFKDIG